MTIMFDKLARSDRFDNLDRPSMTKARDAEREASLEQQKRHLLNDLGKTKAALAQVEHELAELVRRDRRAKPRMS